MADSVEREGEENGTETTDEKGQLVRVTIPVTGMTCGSCVRRVEQALEKKEGVAEASVTFVWSTTRLS